MERDLKSLQDFLLDGDKEALAEIYRLYRGEFINWCKSKYQLDVEEAKEVYQEAIIILYENSASGKLSSFSSSAKTYLFAIGKNKLREVFRKKVVLTDIEDSLLKVERDDDHVERKEILFVTLEKHYADLSDRCQELLRLFYYKEMSIESITDRLEYKNKSSTKNQKYKCLKQLREMCLDEEIG